MKVLTLILIIVSTALYAVGGDTFATATPISTLPFNDSGNTTPFTDTIGNDSQDCFYLINFPQDLHNIEISLYGSDFNSRLRLFDENQVEIPDMNHEGCSWGKIEDLSLEGGHDYYICIEGGNVINLPHSGYYPIAITLEYTDVGYLNGAEPINVSPAMGATNVGLLPNLQWEYSIDTDLINSGYILCLGTGFPILVVDEPDQASEFESYQVTEALMPNTQYLWVVIFQSGTFNFEHVFEFTTGDGTMGHISEYEPLDGQVSEPINTQLSWNFNGDVDQYDLYLDTTYPPQEMIVSNGVAEASECIDVNLAPMTTYYWKVISRNSATREEIEDNYSFTTGDFFNVINGVETADNAPLSTGFKYSTAQFIVLNSEISYIDTPIERISFQLQGDNLDQCNDWKVFIGQTSKDHFSDREDWIPYPSLNLVYEGIIPPIGVDGWIEIPLSSPLVFNPLLNLVIAVNDINDNSYSYGEGISFYGDCTSDNSIRTLTRISHDYKFKDYMTEYGNAQFLQPLLPNLRLGCGCYQDIPEPTLVTKPFDQANDVFSYGSLMWEHSLNTQGYRLSLGTDNPPTNLINNLDIGLTTNYNYSDLQENTQYYWQVIPYNDIGDATNSQIRSFTTRTGENIFFGSGDSEHYGVPVYNNRFQSYSQSLYTHSTLNSIPSKIEHIAFKRKYQYFEEDIANWKILVGHTSKSVFDSNSDWISTERMLEVYNGPMPIETIDQWVEVELDTAFIFNGSDNIVIALFEEILTDESMPYRYISTQVIGTKTLSCGSSDSDTPINIDSPFYGFRLEEYVVDTRFHCTPLETESEVRVSPVELDFGTNSVGSLQESKIIEIQNLGQTPLNIQSILTDDTINYSLLHTQCPFTLMAGGTELVTVNLKRRECGALGNYITILSGMGTTTIPVNAVGTDHFVLSPPYFESFDTDLSPDGWVIEPQLGEDSWFVTDQDARFGASEEATGNGGYYMMQDTMWPNISPVYLNSVPIDISRLSNPHVSFKYWIGSSSNESSMDVLIRTDSDSVIVANAVCPNGTNFWKEQVIPIPELSANTITVTFIGHEALGSNQLGDICLDDVKVFDAPPGESTLNAPEDLTGYLCSSGVCLNWNEAMPSEEDFVGYNVFANGILFNESPIVSSSFFVPKDALVIVHDYEFTVSAVYQNPYRQSVVSNSVSFYISNETDSYYSEDFDSLQNFYAIQGSWSTIDLDSLPTIALPECDFSVEENTMGFITFNPSQTTPPFTSAPAFNGDRYAAAFTPTSGVANDWLLSTPFEIENSTEILNFVTKSYSYDGNPCKFNVLVDNICDDEDYICLNGDTPIEPPDCWTLYEYDLSETNADSIQIVIQNISDNSGVLMIDNIRISNNELVDIEDDLQQPFVTLLGNNYPNPFNPETTIRYNLKSPQHVNISIYNIRGQLVKTITDKYQPTGDHEIVWKGKDNNGRNCSSGVYFYRMTTDNYHKTRKMLLMK